MMPLKKPAGQNSKKMHTTKRSHFSIPWPIPPPSSQAEVDCGVFEVYERTDPLKWDARLPIGHALPTPKASIFSSIFRRHKQSCLSVPRLIRRPKRYPTVDCGMVDFLTGLAGPIWAAYRDLARMCLSLSLDGPALPLILPHRLLLVRRFSRLPGTLCFRSFCRAICSWCDVFRVFLGGDGRAATPAAGKTETAAGTGVIVRRAGLPTFVVADRAISADAAAAAGAGGTGIASPLILSASRRTCCCSDRSAASLSEYPFALIASGIFTLTLVSEFASQATKKVAAFLARRST